MGKITNRDLEDNFKMKIDNKLNEYINVMDFGLLGNDSNNNAVQLQTLLTTIGTIPTDLYFPRGIYRLSATNLETNPTLATDTNSNGIADGFTFTNTSPAQTVTTSIDGGQKMTITSATTIGSSVILEKVYTGLTAGETINLTISYKTDANGNARFGIFKGSNLDVLNTVSNLKSNGVWSEYTYTFTVPVGETSIKVYLAMRVDSIGQTGSVWFKDLNISRRIVIPSNVNLHFANGAILKRTGGAVVTLNCGINAGLWQILDDDGTGSLLGSPNTEEVYPEWFGAKGDGVTDDTVAFANTFTITNTISLTSDKKYLFTGVVNCETKYSININGNNAILINPQFRIAMNGNTWRYPYQGKNCYFKDLTVQTRKDDPYAYASAVTLLPLIVSGAPVILDNIYSYNLPTLVCYADVYIDKMIFNDVVFNKDPSLMNSVVLNAFCRLLSNGTYANVGTENVSAGDGFVFNHCQEFYITTNSNYKLIKSESMQPVVFNSCIQCSVTVGYYSIANFNGCHFEVAFVDSISSSGSIINFNGCFFWMDVLKKQNTNTYYKDCQIHYNLYDDESTSPLFEDNNTFTDTFAIFENCQSYYNVIDSSPKYWNDNFSTNTWLNDYIAVAKETVYDTVNDQAFTTGTYTVTIYLTPKRGYSTTAQYKYTLSYTLASASFIGFKLTNTAGFWVKAYILAPDNTVYNYNYQLPNNLNGTATFSCSKLLSRVSFSDMISINPLSANQIIASKTIASVPTITVNPNIVCINNAIEYKSTSATYNPPSLINSTQTSTTVTATGASLGDEARATFSLDRQGIQIWAEVTSTDTVTVYFRNETGSTIDLGSGTLKVKVIK